MQFSQFDNIRVVLAEPNTAFRKSIKDCLLEHGFKSVLDTGNLAQVVNAVREGNVDLLIADTSLPEGDFNEYVSELRHGKHGDNPFLVVMTMVSKPSRAAIHKAIDSGTDHVVAKPFEAQALVEHATELTHARKQFVVTTDYIGPDRRSSSRGGMEIERIDVPNALRQRMTGHMSEGVLRRTIESANAKINEQKVVRHAYQIGWLLDRMLPEISAPHKSDEFEASMARLGKVSADISRRMRSTRFAHVTEMCMTLTTMVENALVRGFTQDEAQLLCKIAKLIEGAFDPERDEYIESYRRNRNAPAVMSKEDAEASFQAAATVS